MLLLSIRSMLELEARSSCTTVQRVHACLSAQRLRFDPYKTRERVIRAVNSSGGLDTSPGEFPKPWRWKAQINKTSGVDNSGKFGL